MSFYYSITPFIEIIIISIMINYLLSFFWNTRSMDLMLGLLAFLLIFAASSLLKLEILHKLMLLVSSAAVIALLIIFQPELRIALSKLSLKGKRYKEITEFDKFLDQLATSGHSGRRPNESPPTNISCQVKQPHQSSSSQSFPPIAVK